MELLKKMIISQHSIAFILITCYLFTIPFDNYKVLPVSFSTIFGLLTILYTTAQYGVIKHKSFLLVLFFSASLILISLISYSSKFAIKIDELIRNIFLILILTILISSLLSITNRSNSKFSKILTLFQYSAFIAVATGFLEFIAFIFWGELIFNSIHIQKFNFISFPVLRMKGTYFDPNYFSVICFLGYWVTDMKKYRKTNYQRLFKLFFMLGAIFSFSRMGIIAFTIYEGMKAFMKAKKKTRLLVILTIFIITPFVELSLHPIQKTLEIILSSSPESSENRLAHFHEGILLIGQSPFLGYGLGYVPMGGYSHNTFLQTSLYGGLLSIFLLTAFYIDSIARLYNLHTRISRMALSAIASMFVVQLLLSYLLIKYLWFFFYILIQIPLLNEDEKSYTNYK